MRWLPLVLALLVAGCTTPPPPPGPTTPPPGPVPVICTGPLPDEWADRIDDGVLPIEDEDAQLAAASSDGRVVFTTSDVSRRLTMISNGGLREIMRVGDERLLNLGGSDFDGRWLVFAVKTRAGQFWSAYAWDSQSDGDPIALVDDIALDYSGLQKIIVRDGKAVWQSDADLHLYDLMTRRDQVIAKGLRHNPVMFGDLVMWQNEKSRELGAYSITDERPAEVPDALRSVRDVFSLAADGVTFAWVQDHVLHAWRTGWPAVRRLARLEEDTSGWGVTSVSGDLVAWEHKRARLTDLRSDATYEFEVANVQRGLSAFDGVFGIRMEHGLSVVPVADLPPLPNC